MIEQAKIKTWINDFLKKDPEHFLLNVLIPTEDQIIVYVDGDHGITLNRCLEINRFLSTKIENESLNIVIEVSSPGLGKPVKIKRQYNKLIGKIVDVRTRAESYSGKLIQWNDDEIELEWTTREPKPIGKGKQTVIHNKKIELNSIQQAKAQITV